MAGSRSSGRRKARGSAPTRRFPRTARLNALLTEIVGDYFERVDDPDLGFLTVTGVEVDSDLNVAQVFVSVLGSDPADDAEILEALAEHRKPVQRAIATEAKLRKTPEAVFKFDPAVRSGARIESILADLTDVGGADDTETGDTEVNDTEVSETDGSRDPETDEGR